MTVPSQWASLPDWMRIVAVKVNRLLQGYPYLQLDSDPASPTESFTYYNTTSHKVRTWDGSAWNNHW